MKRQSKRQSVKTSCKTSDAESTFYPVTEVPTAAAGKKKNTKEVDLVDKLFTEIAPKYADRNGGYTRIIKIDSVKVTPCTAPCSSKEFFDACWIM